MLILISTLLNFSTVVLASAASSAATASSATVASSTPRMALDDAHNHDGTHVDGQENCGVNYLLPGQTTRLGSHSFMILGQEDETHILVEHRSGTPPHNYQYLLRVKLDPAEMNDYKEILKDSKTLPAFTTIFYDDKGEQAGRTFFCNQDLEKIFGKDQKAADEYAKLFPIKASLQKNPDHEGSFAIAESVVRGKSISIDRADVELVMVRYLPSYLAQDLFKTALKEHRTEVLPRLGDAAAFASEAPTEAHKHNSYMKIDGDKGGKDQCAKSYYLPKVPVHSTLHTFMLYPEATKNSVLAVHFYGYAPQNYQTTLRLKVSDADMKSIRAAKGGALLQTKVSDAFCMGDIRTLVKSGKLKLSGTIYANSDLRDYKLGVEVGQVSVPPSAIEVLVNRRLESYMDPSAVAASVGVK